MNEMSMYYLVAGIISLYLILRIKQRLQLSVAKASSLLGHPRTARRIAGWIPYYSYNRNQVFKLDGAPENIVSRRVNAFEKLTSATRQKFINSQKTVSESRAGVSDMQFINAYRVPFQFRELVNGLQTISFVQSSAGVTLTDIDNNVYYDLSGSYGVNVFGYDFYKDCIAKGSELVKELGPVLGSYHPIVTDNVRRLQKISQQDEVSFHMSGTEAVMQAVRLARYHTDKTRLVRFCGAYHGWWGDVQPGIGNPVTARDTFTLKEMSEATLRVLRKRKDIACILINPLQAMHPNSSAPGDTALLDSSRKANYLRSEYVAWLKQLRQVCDERNIALIFDEVFVGFRLAAGGAQEYFGVNADMVTYGKTLGGGLPVGVLCGKKTWMKRYKDKAPANICFARGTFNSHPYVMGAMNVFLQKIEQAEVVSIYNNIDKVWNARAKQLNKRLNEEDLPVQVVNLSSIWTVLYKQPSSYNCLFQYYLCLEGLALSWVGTGRFIFSLNYTDEDFKQVEERFLRAAQAMQRDGWWWHHPSMTNKTIKRRVLREILIHLFTKRPAVN